MLHSKFSSIIHRFRDNEDFLQTENDVINISPPGGRCVQFSTTEFERAMMVSYKCSIYSNFTSIMHRFRDNDVFLQTGNDVMVIPPLGGAARSFR